MVFKRSEYGREFKIQSLVNNIPTYYDNLTYRSQRRELEYAHTSIAWGENDETAKKEISNEENSSDVNEMNKEEPASDCLKVLDKPKESVCKPAEKTSTQEGKVTESTKGYKGDVEIKSLSKEEGQLRKAAKEKLVKYTCKENIDVPRPKTGIDAQIASQEKDKSSFNLKPKKVDDKTFVNKANIPVQPRVSKSASGARPKSAPSTRQSERAKPRPPFLPYGCGDSERVTGTQRSHNVLASTDVYPAAIKAHKKQVEESIRRKDANVKAAKEAKKRRQLFRDKLMRDAAFWKSEYGFRYPAHPTSEYAKNCDIPKRCRSAFGLV